MNDVGQFAWSHALVLVFSAVAAMVTRALHDNSTLLPISWPASTRIALLGAMTAVSTALDQMVNGADWHMAIVTAAITGLPGLVVELIQFFAKKGGGGGGTGAIDLVADAKKSKPPGPYSAKLTALVLAAFMVTGCASWAKVVMPLISDVAVYIADAQQSVALVQSIINIFFLAHPMPDAQTEVTEVIGEVNAGIESALLATRGATEISSEQMDAAWHDFKGAWKKLQFVLSKHGINVGSGGKMGSKPIVPLAMRGH